MEATKERTHRRFELEYKARIVQEASGLDKEKTKKLLEREGLQPWHLAHWKREIAPAIQEMSEKDKELKRLRIIANAQSKLLKLDGGNGHFKS